MLRKLTYTAGVVALAAGFSGAAPAPASALTINQILAQTIGSGVRFEDNDFENEVDLTNTPGILNEGDRLRGVAIFEAIEELGGAFDVFDLSPTSGHDSLSAIFEVEVAEKIDNGDGTFDFFFDVSSGFEGETGITGAAIQFYSDGNHEDVGDFRTAPDTTTAEGFVTDGNLLWTLGFGDDPDNFWFADDAADDLSVVGAGSSSSDFGGFNFGLDVLMDNLSGSFLDSSVDVGVFDFDPGTGDNMVDFLGSGSLQGGEDATAYEVESDAQLEANFISEPAALGIFGLGLVGLGLAVRRRKTH